MMPEQVKALIHAIIERNGLQKDFLERAIAGLSDSEIEALDQYMTFCLGNGLDMAYLVSAYDQIVKDTLGEQIYFKRAGRYRHSTYDEVAASVYMNDDYMSLYMYGLALTSYLWPNHARMRAYFEEILPRNRPGAYLEIGPGHGMYFMQAMKLGAYTSYAGIDISPTSVKMTRDILSSGVFGTFDNYTVDRADFLELEIDEEYDAVVMGEVLEHVESPGVFLQKIRDISKPDAFIYVTTCMNAPAVDHISLFRSEEELAKLAQDAGLEVAGQLVAPYTGCTLERCRRESLPVNIAMHLALAS